ncbi:YbfB/YjiJ family MFS transporter [Streptomyces sp. BA2]|uniref:YbfB/YjiJ family MFS transporter n=1 Tax=Streptomyces sp. BA2 TaxID=436595 RepID=UPI001921DCC6|nr:YbfB/YjiJ family MFS transporter [Streptomyces sp. BA2]
MATAVRLSLGTASALGPARFAYGLLVPAMPGGLGWTLADAGALSTANGLGYVVGAVLTAALVRRWGTASVFRWGMAATAVTLAGTAASNEFVVPVAMRALAGAAGAAVFIAGGVIAARLAARAGSSAPVAVYFAGTGAGIVLSGAAIPALGDHWWAAWIGLGIAAGIATLISWSATGPDEEKATDGAGRARVRPLRRVALAYLLFAVGYITCITFLSVYLADRHASVLQEILTWTVLGGGVMATPFLWSRPMTRWPGTRVLAAVLGGPRRWRGPASAVILGDCGGRLGGGLRRDVHGSPGGCHRLHPDRAPACRLDRGIGSVHDLVRRGTDRGAVAGRRSRRTHHHRRATGVDRPPECRRGRAFGNPEQAGTPHRGTFWDQRPEHGFSTMNSPAVLAEPPWEEKSL